MTDHATAGRHVDTTTAPPRPMRDPWDTVNDFPEHPRPAAATHPGPRPMLEDAFTYTSDRLDRLEHMLGSLNGTLMRAGTVLEPLLTGGTYRDPEADLEPKLDAPEPEDRRSTLAKRIARHGLRADNLADAVVLIERRLEAILDALEIG